MPLIVYFGIGFAEWILAMVRMAAFVRDRMLIVGWLVMLEIRLGLYVFKAYVVKDNAWIAFAYSIGGGIGAMAGAYIKRIAGRKDRPDSAGADGDDPLPE